MKGKEECATDERSSRSLHFPLCLCTLSFSSQGHLDPAWSAMYAGHRFVKSFEQQVGKGAVCFRHAVFAPYGYHSPIDSAVTHHRPHEGEWRELAGQRGYSDMTPRR